MTVRISAQFSTKQQAAAAGWLFDHVIERGDRIAIVAEPSASYLAVALGALRTGVIPVLIPSTLDVDEQAALIEDADVMLVLRDDDLDQLVEWPGARRSELSTVPLGRPLTYTSARAGGRQGVSTGVISEAHARAWLMDDSEQWGFCATDVHLLVEPLHRSSAFQFAVGTLIAGGDVVIPTDSDPATLRAAIKQYRPTTSMMTPAGLASLFSDAGDLPSLNSFRLVAHSGAPCPDEVRHEAARWLPRGSLWEFYSATEGHFTACSYEDWADRPGTVGRVRRGRKLSIDADSGMIWCKSPAHCAFEYWRAPAQTAASWRDKSFTVGDRGRLDGEGFLYLDRVGASTTDASTTATSITTAPTSLAGADSTIVDAGGGWAPPNGSASVPQWGPPVGRSAELEPPAGD